MDSMVSGSALVEVQTVLLDAVGTSDVGFDVFGTNCLYEFPAQFSGPLT